MMFVTHQQWCACLGSRLLQRCSGFSCTILFNLCCLVSCDIIYLSSRGQLWKKQSLKWVKCLLFVQALIANIFNFESFAHSRAAKIWKLWKTLSETHWYVSLTQYLFMGKCLLVNFTHTVYYSFVSSGSEQVLLNCRYF